MTQLTIILVEPQLGWNIGSVARVMLNYGLTELRIVNPRDGWPNPDATATAAGADLVLNNVKIFSSFRESVADLHTVYATTVRAHDMIKSVYTPHNGVRKLAEKASQDQRIAVAFGGESSGLVSEDVSLCEGIITVATNPEFSSLNLAHAVGVMAYEWSQVNETHATHGKEAPLLATKEEMNLLFDHLEGELDDRGFLLPVEKRAGMVKNIRNIFTRIQPTQQEVRTLRGIIRYLSRDFT